jgi:hypothetical protein
MNIRDYVLARAFPGLLMLSRAYRSMAFIPRTADIDFHVIEDGKLIIQGAYSMADLPDGLYLDCAPDVEWEHPVPAGNVLYVTQVYAATQNGNVLGVT